MDPTSDGANPYQGQEGALGSSIHHFLALCTSDQPKKDNKKIIQRSSKYGHVSVDSFNF